MTDVCFSAWETRSVYIIMIWRANNDDDDDDELSKALKTRTGVMNTKLALKKQNVKRK